MRNWLGEKHGLPFNKNWHLMENSHDHKVKRTFIEQLTVHF